MKLIGYTMTLLMWLLQYTQENNSLLLTFVLFYGSVFVFKLFSPL